MVVLLLMVRFAFTENGILTDATFPISSIYVVYQEWSHELLLMLENRPLLPSLTGVLTLELGFHWYLSPLRPPAFGAFVNAYLDNVTFCGRIQGFDLTINCSYVWGNYLTNRPGCGWDGIDARLSDALRLPRLQSAKVTLVNTYLYAGEIQELWGEKEGGYEGIATGIGDEFFQSRARGLELTVELLNPVAKPNAAKFQF